MINRLLNVYSFRFNVSIQINRLYFLNQIQSIIKHYHFDGRLLCYKSIDISSSIVQFKQSLIAQYVAAC